MNLLGRLVSRAKAAIEVTSIPTSAFDESPSWWRTIGESFAGAWQRNITVESQKNILAFSAVYACVSMIAEDISKLRLRLMELSNDGIWVEVQGDSPFWPVLRKPNQYQTRIQFFVYWMTSRLLYGNVYVLKERDSRGIVVGLHILDPRLVRLLVTPDGGVYYELKKDNLSRGLQEQIVVPGDEIIHDRAITLWHPLIGVSPIYACGSSATQGIRIQANSAIFFENMSRPSGQLTAPGEITDATANRLKNEFETTFRGGGMGRLFVSGDGLKYEPMSMPAVDAQLIEQLDWTVKDVARAFRIPLHKLATGDNPSFNNVGAMNLDYYAQTLQNPIESIELLLEEGLNLRNVRDKTYGIEFDVGGLLRMDPTARAEANAKLVTAGISSPNEARFDANLPPVKGGHTPYLQQQNWSLEQLAERPAALLTPSTAPPPASPATPATPAPADPPDDGTDAAKMLSDRLIAKFLHETANMEVL